MNKLFVNRLTSYLDSECDDYDMDYDYRWDEDIGCCVVTIKSSRKPDVFKEINFKYDETSRDLKIELSEDSFYVTREFDHTVKCFWMLVAPVLFPN